MRASVTYTQPAHELYLLVWQMRGYLTKQSAVLVVFHLSFNVLFDVELDNVRCESGRPPHEHMI